MTSNLIEVMGVNYIDLNLDKFEDTFYVIGA